MALSILMVGSESYGLFDSETDRFLMIGTEKEMEYFKNMMEELQQARLNKEHFAELKEQYINQLVAGGNTNEQAEKFLKQRMPFLFT